ncbi:hypothetical protein AWB76_06308 [Caballeronia temeraria]|uniref:Uncharacterized protein n=1 Tax=Caballeronia temeraria TaxID=1777137 RepID=A0A158D0V6_9BURK|nr:MULTISPECIES: hypothetical protein [Caballeronia]MDR5797244.1 hypothetical protein [Caballeronia sp. LZ008]SAK88285.1 hypothetical protein AWB76_06308 [Caballeronia temeraria]
MATNEKMVEAVVARNRTIHDQLKPNEEPVIKTAGQKVRLPESEVKRLRDLGFLVPEKVEEVKLEGAQITGGQVSINESE